MTNKYVTSPCIPHFPRYKCIGEETEYVVKDGAKGTTPHAKPNNKTAAHVVEHAYKHEPHPYPHFSVDSKHREVQEDGDKVKKKSEVMGWPRTKEKQ